MADIKQNSETEKINSTTTDKTTTGGSGAASTRQAKDDNPKPGGNVGGKQNESPAKDTISEMKEATGNIAGQAIGQVKDKATSVIGEQKTNLASGIGTVADSIRQIGENLSNTGDHNQVAALAGKYGDTLAEQVEKFSSYIDEKEFRELARDLEQFARRNPLLFVGSAFTLGILAARFLKSSGRGQSSGNRSRNNRSRNSSTSAT